MVYKSSPNRNTPVLTAPETASCHTAGSILTRRNSMRWNQFCVPPPSRKLGAAPLHSATELGLLLERYRTNVLEPIELPAIARAHREAAQGRALELIELDQQFAGQNPEWLLLTRPAPALDRLSESPTAPDERTVQRLIEAVRFGRTPGHHHGVWAYDGSLFNRSTSGACRVRPVCARGGRQTAAGKLKLTQADRDALLARSQACLPKAIERMAASRRKGAFTN